MSDTTVRTQVSESESTPAPVPEEKNPDRVSGSDSQHTPIALYEELKGHPYSAEHFGIKDTWNVAGLSYESDVRSIDQYYRKLVSTGKINDGKESFNKFIKEAEKVTDTKDASTNLKVAKIAEYARFMANLREIDNEHNKE